jgi:hypothetical protein
MLWYDTAANILKMRSEADDAWINVAYVDQSANAWRVLNNTQVVNTSGTTIGYLGVHATSVWQSGVDTNDKLVSPAKVKAAIQALVPAGIGVGQTWQAVSRSVNVWYQNTTGRSIGVYAYGSIGGGVVWDVGVSTSNYINISMSDGDSDDSADYGWIIVPVDHYYRNTGTWNSPRELR